MCIKYTTTRASGSCAPPHAPGGTRRTEAAAAPPKSAAAGAAHTQGLAPPAMLLPPHVRARRSLRAPRARAPHLPKAAARAPSDTYPGERGTAHERSVSSRCPRPRPSSDCRDSTTTDRRRARARAGALRRRAAPHYTCNGERWRTRACMAEDRRKQRRVQLQGFSVRVGRGGGGMP